MALAIPSLAHVDRYSLRLFFGCYVAVVLAVVLRTRLGRGVRVRERGLRDGRRARPACRIRPPLEGPSPGKRARGVPARVRELGVAVRFNLNLVRLWFWMSLLFTTTTNTTNTTRMCIHRRRLFSEQICRVAAGHQRRASGLVPS